MSAFATIVAVIIKEHFLQRFTTDDFSSYRDGRLLILSLCSVHVDAFTEVSVCDCSSQMTFSLKTRMKFLYKSN